MSGPDDHDDDDDSDGDGDGDDDWLRRSLRQLDLQDALAKRDVPTKAGCIARVRSVIRSKKAQKVAASCAKGLKSVCRTVVSKHGAASGH